MELKLSTIRERTTKTTPSGFFSTKVPSTVQMTSEELIQSSVLTTSMEGMIESTTPTTTAAE